MEDVSSSGGSMLNLRAECHGHAEDVRAVCATGAGFVTASRDRTAKVWAERDPHSFDNLSTLVGHQDYVGAVTTVPAGAVYPEGSIVTGSRDKTIIVWDSQTSQPIRRLAGHKWQVTAVVTTADGSVASASLDGTIRIWDAEGSSQVLEGHEGPVQCLLVLPDGTLVSGSNDKTIKLWSGVTCVQTLTGHSDTVRGLCLLPGIGFVSASHDQTLQVWTASGSPVATLVGHTALVYSAAATAEGLIASASEDNTVRLWRADGRCLQVLEHPACVWDVAFLPNGDLVTACADHVARVWTSTPDRAAPAETIQAYQAVLEARKAASSRQGQGGLPEGLTLEDPMALLQPGKKDGQTKIIREADSGMAYSWSAARQEWEKLGEVVSGPEMSDNMAVGGKTLHGQTWDYVFDVDIEDGAPVKKLAVNRGENPYDAADRFLIQENLPVTYKEQIVNFIVQNSHGGITLPAGPSTNVDPFTGGGAYVPSSGFSSAGTSSAGQTVTGGGADPFTGGSSAPALANAAAHIPAKSFVTFANAPNADAIARKVRDTSAQLEEVADVSDLALSVTEAAPGGVLDQLLTRAAASGAGGAAPPSDQLALLAKMLRWPTSQLFPALDIARLLALDTSSAAALAETAGELTASGGRGIGTALATAMTEPQSTANQQTALRLICNCFQQPGLRQWVRAQAANLMDGFASCTRSPAKAVRQGMATFLLNCAVLQDEDLRMQVLSALAELLSSTPEGEPETLYRTLVAIGTVVHQDSMTRSVAVDLDIIQQVKQRQSSAAGKVAGACADVIKVLT